MYVHFQGKSILLFALCEQFKENMFSQMLFFPQVWPCVNVPCEPLK